MSHTCHCHCNFCSFTYKSGRTRLNECLFHMLLLRCTALGQMTPCQVYDMCLSSLQAAQVMPDLVWSTAHVPEKQKACEYFPPSVPCLLLSVHQLQPQSFLQSCCWTRAAADWQRHLVVDGTAAGIICNAQDKTRGNERDTITAGIHKKALNAPVAFPHVICNKQKCKLHIHVPGL